MFQIVLLLYFTAFPDVNAELVIRRSPGMTDGKYIQVNLMDERIVVTGSNYTHKTSRSITFDRFPEDVLNLPAKSLSFNTSKARTTTGVTVRFSTSSPGIILKFRVTGETNRGHDFAVFQDDSLTEVFHFNRKADTVLILEINSCSSGKEVDYMVTMPNWSNTSLTCLALKEGFDLGEVPGVSGKILVTSGNSITHGTGQRGTHMTYPFILSERLRTELYNFAVGGSRVSVPIAEMLNRDMPDIDIFILLIGYNDFFGFGISTQLFAKNYSSFVDTFRLGHPQTEIFCITPTAVKNPLSPVTGLNIELYSSEIEKIVNDRKYSDNHIHLIKGDRISDVSMLRDNVHFSESGAENFAEALYSIILPYINIEE